MTSEVSALIGLEKENRNWFSLLTSLASLLWPPSHPNISSQAHLQECLVWSIYISLGLSYPYFFLGKRLYFLTIFLKIYSLKIWSMYTMYFNQICFLTISIRLLSRNPQPSPSQILYSFKFLINNLLSLVKVDHMCLTCGTFYWGMRDLWDYPPPKSNSFPFNRHQLLITPYLRQGFGSVLPIYVGGLIALILCR